MPDDVRVPLRQMSQAWSDIQGYTSNMWQISALCLTVVAFSINIFASTLLSEPQPPSWTWQAMLLFALSFVVVTIYTMQWLRSSIVTRVAYILRTEETIARISSERSIVGSSDLFNVTEGPMRAFLYFFYLLASIFGFLVVLPLLEILVSAQISPLDSLNLLVIAATTIVALITLFQRFMLIRVRERLVGETAEATTKAMSVRGEITPLRLGYTNTALKEVFGHEWNYHDVSIWHSKDEQPWKTLAYSVHLPESVRTLEIPYAPLLEFNLRRKMVVEHFINHSDLLDSYPLLGEAAKTLTDGAYHMIWTKIQKLNLVIILRIIEEGVRISTKQVLNLRETLTVVVDTLGTDLFNELEGS